MPNTFLLTDTDAAITIATTDNYFLAQGVTHYSTAANTTPLTIAGASSATHYVTILGTIYAIGNYAVSEITGHSVGSTIYAIGPDALVSGSFGAIISSQANVVLDNYGTIIGSVNLSGANARVSNHGEISTPSSTSHGIKLSLGMNVIENTGLIDGGTYGIYFSAGVPTDFQRVFNTGTISGETKTGIENAGLGGILIRNQGTISYGGNVQGNGYGAIINGVNSGDTTIDNSGTLHGDIRLLATGETNRIVNTGLINGLISVDSATIVNSGTIQSAFDAISLGGVGAASRVVNSGLIDGAITLTGSADVVINTGTLTGLTDLGGGADTYRASGQGVGTTTVTGGDGIDTLIGGDQGDILAGGLDGDSIRGEAGNDELYGDGGADTVRGGAGEDNVFGGTENDRLFGDAGDDTLNGNDGADTIYGNAGDDSVVGSTGDDVLYGNLGNDTLQGGTGRDVITGNDGADSLVFVSASESAVGALRDVIRDFQQGQDDINLINVASGLFTFRGTQAFTGTANEVRLLELSSGSTIVAIDSNADGVTDTEISVLGVTGLTALDFQL